MSHETFAVCSTPTGVLVAVDTHPKVTLKAAEHLLNENGVHQSNVASLNARRLEIGEGWGFWYGLYGEPGAMLVAIVYDDGEVTVC